MIGRLKGLLDEKSPGEVLVDVGGVGYQAAIPLTTFYRLPEAGQAAVYAGMRAPSRSSEDYVALELANSVLGGGSSGRLFEEVRTKRSISYGAYSGLPARADDAYLIASAQTQNATADEVVQVFLDFFLGNTSNEIVGFETGYRNCTHSLSEKS